MSDLAELFVIVILLYLLECVVWVRRSGLALLRTWGRTRVLTPPEVLGNSEAGLVASNPLPPQGDLFLVSSWPCSLSPMGLTTRTALQLDGAERPFGETTTVNLDTLGSAQAVDSQVRFSDGARLHTGSPGAARRWAGRLQALPRTDSREQATRIRAWLRESLDVEELRRRLGTFDRSLDLLDPALFMLFGLIFLVAPLIVAEHGLERTWVSLLSVIGAAWLTVLVAYRRAYRRIHPQGAGAPVSLWLGMALLPLAALRARDSLARRHLDGLDPVVCAAVLAGPRAATLVRSAQRQLAYPTGDEDAASERWFRRLYREELATALEKLGFPEAEALRPPPREPECLAYCPRCHDQFTAIEATCSACAEGGLTSFPGLDVPRP